MSGEFVVDASMALSWLIDSEATAFTEAVLDRVVIAQAVAPAAGVAPVDPSL